jgi:hypothetical protein
MKPSESANLVATLMAAFPQSKMTSATSAVYERQLADLDVRCVTVAVERLVNTLNWLPTIAQIRAEAATVLHGHRRLGGEAWGDVVAEMRRVGWYGVPRFDDPVVSDAVRMLGWQGLCSSTNEIADRARFTELYDGLAERQRKETVVSIGLALPAAQAVPRIGAAVSNVLAGLVPAKAGA